MNDEGLYAADRLFDAIERGDFAALAHIFTEDARIWHNFDGQEQTVEENRANLERLAAVLRNWRYRSVRRAVFPDGFVQQHILHGSLPDNSELALPMCVVGRLDGSRISRVDEYFDAARFAPVRAFVKRTGAASI